jgi:sirohydrochlorin cobaltochelatase
MKAVNPPTYSENLRPMAPSSSFSRLDGLFLCAHGSQDHRAQKGLRTLTEQVQAAMPTVTVGCGVLEMGLQPLEQQIDDFLTAHQLPSVMVLPLFLLSGVHAEVDIPEAIARVGARVQQTKVLGQSARLVEFLARTTVLEPDEGIVLFAHGSRRQEANRQVRLLAESLAQSVQAPVVPAFLKEEGSLQQAISQLQSEGRRVLILPHFLFLGSVIDYLVELIQEMDAVRLAPVLSERPGFAQLAVSHVQDALPAMKRRVSL